MTAVWIASVLFALAFAAILSGGLLRRVLDRLYRARLRSRALRVLGQRARAEVLAEVAGQLEALRRERSDLDAELERERVGRLVLRRQALFAETCQLEDWHSALEQTA